jgi:dethiobiotin synthetase
MRGLFVTGTDTGVGKSIVAAAIVAALAHRGVRVAAYKPVLTGTDEAPEGWPADHELLASVAGSLPEEVAPLRFGPAVSPHLAAQLAGRAIDPRELIRSAQAAGADADLLVVEGVGGLLVPLTTDFAVRDLAAALGLPVVIAARPGLGTINHTLLTIEAARAAALDVRAVVFTPWPATPSAMEQSNADTIAALGQVPVAGLPAVEAPEPEALARAGGALPIGDWVGDAVAG